MLQLEFESLVFAFCVVRSQNVPLSSEIFIVLAPKFVWPHFGKSNQFSYCSRFVGKPTQSHTVLLLQNQQIRRFLHQI